MMSTRSFPEQVECVAVDQRRLLLACVRQALGTGEAPSPALRTSVNWRRLLQLGKQYQVVPLLHKALGNAEWVPAVVKMWTEQYCRTVVSHNLSLASELISILDALRQAGVAAVPFKGPAWTRALYDNLTDRQMADLDLFVEQSEVPRACTVLEECGYTREQFRTEDLDRRDIGFLHPATGHHLQLQWSACEGWRDQRLALLHLWTPHSAIPLLDGEVPLPSAENMLFLLVIHGFRHGWNSLKLVCDIAALLKVFPDLDFEQILRRGAEISRMRMFLVALALTEQLLEVKLPPPIASALQGDRIISEIAAQIARRHFTAEADRLESQGSEISGRLYAEWLRAQICDSRWERMGWRARCRFGHLRPNPNGRLWLERSLPEPIDWILEPWHWLLSYGAAQVLRLRRHFVPRSAP